MSILNFFRREDKSVPPINPLLEETRDGISKAFIPEFLYKPPYGYPRYSNLPELRKLANTPFVEMCITTTINEITALKWDIVVDEDFDFEPETKQKEIDHVRSFFKNPNTNKESFEEIIKKICRDILEIDSGVINKVFNKKKEMVEIYAKDGATFTKNPDIFGLYTERDDLMLEAFVGINLTENQARERGAYFQYGWVTAAYPVAFGKREIVWLEQNPRTDRLYGRSPVEVLDDTLKTLIYAIESNLEYYNDNSIPKGIIGLEGADSDAINAFKKQWIQQQRTKDFLGNWKKIMHHLPIVNRKPEFTRIQFSNAELEMIAQQQWFSKMVWACFGVTPSELGYTEDSNKATEIVQSNVFRRKAINPLVRLLEYKINHEIVSEFEYEGIKFKYDTFDIAEETKKTELFEKQIKNGLRTVNEVRISEGLDEVEWGDDPPKNWQSGGSNFQLGMPQNTEVEKEESDQTKIPEDKSITRDNPLILREGEVMTSKKLEKGITHLLGEDEKKIKELLTKEYGSGKLKEIKSIDDVINSIKGLLDIELIRRLSNAIISNKFMKGWDVAEKKLDRNFMPDKNAVEYLQNYTFANIKNMSEEIANDLRQELQRGIINGEGIEKLKGRVTSIFNKAEARAEMIARTETNRAENQGSLQVMKASGKKIKKVWVSAMDDRTSPICKRLNGQSTSVNEGFKDKTTDQEFQSPPAHVNCRSTIVYEIEDE